MMVPKSPRVISYMDAQWFLRASKFTFDAQLPNINPRKLTEKLAAQHGWSIAGVKMYVDIPAPEDSMWWSRLWGMRIADLESQDILIRSTVQHMRPAFSMDGGMPHKVQVRSDLETVLQMSLDIAIDVARNNADVVLMFTSENKYLETTEYIKSLSRKLDNYLKVVSAFPYNAERSASRFAGIAHTDWLRIERDTYEACTDFIRKPKPVQQRQETTEDEDVPTPESWNLSNDVTRNDEESDSRSDD